MYKDNKFVQFLNSFFISIGCVTIIFIILNLCRPAQVTIKYLWAFVSIASCLSLSGSLIFKTGVSRKSLWIRRAVIMGISCIVVPGFLVLYQIIRYDDLKDFLFYMACSVIILPIIAAGIYKIADKIEQKTLDKINLKLAKNDK